MSLTPFTSPRHSRWAWLLAAGLLLLPAACNGLPLMYPDTPTYLRGAEAGLAQLLGPGRLPSWLGEPPAASAVPRPTTASAGPQGGEAPALPPKSPGRAAGLSAPQEGVVLAGRSIYYGALLEASQLAGSLWWAVAFQALCLAWLMHLLLVTRWGLPIPAFLAIAGLLALATPAGLFTGLLMPDIFAGLAILASALLMAEGKTLQTSQRIGVALLLLFALCAHASHLATAALLLALGTGWTLWNAWTTRAARSSWAIPTAGRATGARGPWAGGLAWVAACVVGALLAEAAFSRVVTQALGAPPLRLPHLTARLVDQGPGTGYLHQVCPELAPDERWAACNYRDRFPLPWTDFLFEPDPARGVFAPADAATKRRLSQEQIGLAWQVLRHDPTGVLGDMAADTARQLTEFRIDIWGLGPGELAMYEGRVPSALMAALRDSRGARAPQWQDRFSALALASTGAGALLLLGYLACRWRRRAAARELATCLVALVLAGLLMNAAVCAALAAPLDRFQARVVWLLPLLAAGLCARAALLRAAAAAPRMPGWPAHAAQARTRKPQGAQP